MLTLGTGADMESTYKELGRIALTNNNKAVAIVLFSVLLCSLGAVFAVDTAGASEQTKSSDIQLDVEPEIETELASAQAGPPTPVVADSETSIDDDAFREYDWGIVPEDAEVEAANDTVDVAITAQDLGADPGLTDIADGDVTSFRFDVEYDESVLDFTGDVDLIAGAISATDNEDDAFDYEHHDGSVTADWYVDIGLGDVRELFSELLDDDGVEDPFPEFDDEPLIALEFEPTASAEAGDVSEISIDSEDTQHSEHDEPTVWGGLTGLSDYDSDNVWWGDGEVEIVPESLDPAIDGADGSFDATGDGGYIDFGQPEDPGETEDTLATFPDSDAGEQIQVEADFISEDGQWRAEPDDVDFPEIEAGEDDAPARVVVDSPLEGEIDLEDGSMTGGGDMTVEVNAVDEDYSFSFDATTDQSGELEGNVGQMDVDPETLDGAGEVTLVDNELVVLEDENADVDILRDDANLERDGEWAADEEGMNYLVFDLIMDFEEFVGEDSTLAGEVVDSAGEPIENASVDLVDSFGDDMVTGDSGSFEIDGFDPDTWDVRVNAEGYEPVEDRITFEPLETTERTFELEEHDANFDVEINADDELAEGETLPVSTTIENTDDGVDEQTIELTVDGETVDSKTVTLGEDIDDDVTPDLFDSETGVNFQWEAPEEGEYELVVESEDDTDSIDVTVVGEDDIDIDAIMNVEFQHGSYFAFNVDDLEEAQPAEEGVHLPPQDEDGSPLTFRAEVVDGEWSAGPDDITFPDFEALGFGAEPDIPLGLEGEIDTENGEMTLEGEFDVDVPDVSANLAFDAESTTGDSGIMSGDADLAEDGGTVELVANDFTLPSTGSDDIDQILEPPVDEDLNYLDIVAEVDIEEIEDEDALAAGDIAGVVTDQDGEPLDNATVALEDVPGETTTGEDGSYELTDVDTGSQNLVVSDDTIEDETITVDIEEETTVEQDVEVEVGEPEFEYDLDSASGEPGDNVTASATVTNTGAGPGTESVTLSIGEEEVTEEVDLEPGEEETVTAAWETTEDDSGEFAASLETEDGTEEASDEIEIEELENQFVATGQGGFIELPGEKISIPGEDELDDVAAENPLQVVGEIEDDGTWEASSENIAFPLLEADNSDAEVTAPDGLEGTIDEDTGEMTVNGNLEVKALLPDDTFDFDVALVSGESGDMSGSAEISDDTATTTLVDNEFDVASSDSDIIDGDLGLPSDAGESALEIGLAVELDADDDVTDVAGGGGGEDSDEDEEDENEAGSSLLTTFGLLGGVAGVAAAVLLLVATVVGRFLDVPRP